ncbi:MAG: hypothetical protein K0S33_1998 [Bacteroidetes bacterium]|jgi:hypothetical protein|nr:hypothetical protein [Bacteroidota bacterium]
MIRHLFILSLVLLFACISTSCKTFFIYEEDFAKRFAAGDSAALFVKADSMIVYKENGRKRTILLDSSWKIDVHWFEKGTKRRLFEASELSYKDSAVCFKKPVTVGLFRKRERTCVPMDKIEVLLAKNIRSGDNRLWLKFAPLALADPYGGNCFRGGIEAKLYRNIAFSAEAGGYIPNGLAGISNVNGLILRPEVKLYLNKEGKTIGNYASMEYIYKDSRFDMTDSIQGLPKYEKTYRMHRKAQAVLLKWGKQYVHGNRFVFDFHFGGGVRRITGSSDLSDIEQSNIVSGEGHGGILYSLVRTTDTYYAPQLTVGFKLGLRIL